MIRTFLVALALVIIGVWLIWPAAVSQKFVGWVSFIIGIIVILLGIFWVRAVRTGSGGDGWA